MKNISRFLVLITVVSLVFSGCGKKPVQEMNDAEAAISAAIKAGAEIYAQEELLKLNNDLAAAKNQLDIQDKKLIKKYGAAREMLTKIAADASALQATVASRKEEAKNNAASAQNEAKAALDEAKALLEKAPTGKGARADIEALRADLKALEGSLSEVQQAIDSEDYLGAADRARIIQEKASGISSQIKQALEKVKKK
jgi:tRNA U34 5-carboxymethylaminomethyl modifying GTPase MnmE/TrmE